MRSGTIIERGLAGGLAVAAAWGLSAAAGQPSWAGAGSSAPLVAEIAPAGLLAPRTGGGRPREPEVLASAAAAARVLDAATLQRVTAEVDFAQRQLLLFAWSGSGQDRMTFQVVPIDGRPTIVFQYRPGRTRDLRRHVMLYAAPPHLGWKVELALDR